jgi:ribosomal protein L14E/L6E/L27E
MNPFEMVVLIVLIVTIGRVAASRMGDRRGKRGAIVQIDRNTESVAEAERLRSEVTRLNERIQVLERLATDPGKRLSDEIEALKNQ